MDGARRVRLRSNLKNAARIADKLASPRFEVPEITSGADPDTAPALRECVGRCLQEDDRLTAKTQTCVCLSNPRSPWHQLSTSLIVPIALADPMTRLRAD